MTVATSDLPLIARLLLKQGVLDEDKLPDIQSALARYPNRPEEALVWCRVVDEKSVAMAHAAHLAINWLECKQVDDELHILSNRDSHEPVELGTISEIGLNCWDIADIISEAICRKYLVMPVAIHDGYLDLACVNPSEFAAVEEVRMRAGCLVRLHAVTLSLLETLSTAVFGEPDSVREIASEGEGAELFAGGGDDEGEVQTILDLDAPVPQTKSSQVQRIVNTILCQSIDDGVSDIHIEPYEDSVRVRFRVDGKLRDTTAPPMNLFVPAVSRLKILAQMDISERRIPQDGAIALKYKGARVDLRVSTVPTVYGEKMVIRVLEKSGIPESLVHLGFSQAQADAFLDAARAPHGLMFVTGPTGSGKSTTLYCCLNLINEPDENIVTVEDPVEYKFYGLNQVHVRSKVGMSFANALRAFLRQDPDKIMVGEVRDQETAEICMRAALTGHLVLSTLHTNSALQVVNRLIDMGIEPFLLAPALRLVEAQRLARKLCPDCKQAYELPDDVAARHGLEPGLTIYRASTVPDCKTCRGSGTKGRLGLYEVVPVNESIRDLIAKRADQGDMEAVARESGIRFLNDDGRDKVTRGLIGLEEVSQLIRVAK